MRKLTNAGLIVALITIAASSQTIKVLKTTNDIDKFKDGSGARLQNVQDLKLVDYKVRILNTGTNATTRVSIESTDRQGKSWFTIGVSPNIIEASFKALIDSLDYKLYKEKAPANN